MYVAIEMSYLLTMMWHTRLLNVYLYYLFIYLFIHSFAIIILEECVSSSGAWVLLVGWLLSFIALVSLIN